LLLFIMTCKICISVLKTLSFLEVEVSLKLVLIAFPKYRELGRGKVAWNPRRRTSRILK
jgi:hypothetical protein